AESHEVAVHAPAATPPTGRSVPAGPAPPSPPPVEVTQGAAAVKLSGVGAVSCLPAVARGGPPRGFPCQAPCGLGSGARQRALDVLRRESSHRPRSGTLSGSA